jgi:hypothetical protein
MGEIESEIKEMLKKFAGKLPGGPGMKGLLVTALSLLAAYMTYKWLKHHLADLVQ